MIHSLSPENEESVLICFVGDLEATGLQNELGRGHCVKISHRERMVMAIGAFLVVFDLQRVEWRQVLGLSSSHGRCVCRWLKNNPLIQ